MPAKRKSTSRLRGALLQDALRILAEDYASDLSLDDVARRVAASRRGLQRAFREDGGTTFREQLARVRMERAAGLLARGGLTVREVARGVGYRQPAQFAKAFRRHFGAAPLEYRAVHSAPRTPGVPGGLRVRRPGGRIAPLADAPVRRDRRRTPRLA